MSSRVKMSLLSGRQKISKLHKVHNCLTCGMSQRYNPFDTSQNAAGDSNQEQKESKSREIENLKMRLSEVEEKCNSLFFENEQINIDLLHERHKVMQLERKLQYVKDNQGIFDKLKEAYISMKYNESSDRKLIEIRDKSVQTWDGIVCRTCVETEKLRSELESIKITFDDNIVMTKDQMRRLDSTLEDLKECALTLTSSSPSRSYY